MIPRDPPTHCSLLKSDSLSMVSEGSSSPSQEGYPLLCLCAGAGVPDSGGGRTKRAGVSV
jgi:hypothetical protein